MYASKMKVTFAFFELGLTDFEAYFNKKENSSRKQKRENTDKDKTTVYLYA